MPEQIFYLLHWHDESTYRCTNELYATLDLAVEKGYELYNNLHGSPSSDPKEDQLAEFKNLLIYPKSVKDADGMYYYQIYPLTLNEEPPVKHIPMLEDDSDDDSSE